MTQKHETNQSQESNEVPEFKNYKLLSNLGEGWVHGRSKEGACGRYSFDRDIFKQGSNIVCRRLVWKAQGEDYKRLKEQGLPVRAIYYLHRAWESGSYHGSYQYTLKNHIPKEMVIGKVVWPVYQVDMDNRYYGTELYEQDINTVLRRMCLREWQSLEKQAKEAGTLKGRRNSVINYIKSSVETWKAQVEEYKERGLRLGIDPEERVIEFPPPYEPKPTSLKLRKSDGRLVKYASAEMVKDVIEKYINNNQEFTRLWSKANGIIERWVKRNYLHLTNMTPEDYFKQGMEEWDERAMKLGYTQSPMEQRYYNVYGRVQHTLDRMLKRIMGCWLDYKILYNQTGILKVGKEMLLIDGEMKEVVVEYRLSSKVVHSFRYGKYSHHYNYTSAYTYPIYRPITNLDPTHNPKYKSNYIHINDDGSIKTSMYTAHDTRTAGLLRRVGMRALDQAHKWIELTPRSEEEWEACRQNYRTITPTIKNLLTSYSASFGTYSIRLAWIDGVGLYLIVGCHRFHEYVFRESAVKWAEVMKVDVERVDKWEGGEVSEERQADAE